MFVNATVRLYLDDGSGTPNAADALVATTTTNASGAYSFTALPAGTYWVAVDSKTPAAPGYNGLFGINDVWAEQTWGDDSTTAALDVAARYGGRSAATSDNAAALATAEHLARGDVTPGSVANVNYGFSFNVVDNLRGDAADDDGGLIGRMQQGSLRQFILNANAISSSVCVFPLRR